MAFSRFPLLLLLKSSKAVGSTGSQGILYDTTTVVVLLLSYRLNAANAPL